jgi:hypothetical protein
MKPFSIKKNNSKTTTNTTIVTTLKAYWHSELNKGSPQQTTIDASSNGHHPPIMNRTSLSILCNILIMLGSFPQETWCFLPPSYPLFVAGVPKEAPVSVLNFSP